MELSEINYLKSIAGTKQIIINKSFLSFSLNKQKSIQFQTNTVRYGGPVVYTGPTVYKIGAGSGTGAGPESGCIIANPPKKKKEGGHLVANPPKKQGLCVLIEIDNISEYERNNYMISNALLYDISYYTKEEEVLIFPFTGFEVTGWQETDVDGEAGTSFSFKFSKKYFQKLKEKYGSK